MDIQSTHMLLVVIMAIFGLIFAAMSEAAFKELKGSCKSRFIRNGWTIIQALSVSFIVASIFFVICIMDKGADCYGILKEKAQIGSSNPYIIVLFLISGAIMGVGIGMIVEYYKLTNEELDPCDGDTGRNKKMVIGITVLSSLVFLGTLGRLGWVWYENYVIEGTPPATTQQRPIVPFFG